MEKFLQNIQNQPEYIRWRILYGILAICMVAVVALWIWTIRGQILPEKEAKFEETISTPSPFKLLKDSGTVVFQDFMSGIDKIKSDFKE